MNDLLKQVQDALELIVESAVGSEMSIIAGPTTNGTFIISIGVEFTLPETSPIDPVEPGEDNRSD